MLFTGLFVAGTGHRLAPPLRVEEAVARGLCASTAVWRTGIEAVRVSQGASGPEMAAEAARGALRMAGASRADLTLHASTYHQGHDMWAPASYVQRVALGAGSGPAFEVRQMSNGGMAALELAAGHLLADPARTTALVTTGDRFCPPGFDRWTTDPGTLYADGGTALVLSTRDGFARVLAAATVSDPGLEGMQRGRRPFGAAPLEHGSPVDVESARRAFVSEHGLDGVLERIDAGQDRVVDLVLEEAGLKLGDLDRFVLPHLGRARMRAHFFDRFGIAPQASTWEWGRGVGHLGAGDQCAGLHHLVTTGGLAPGQRCLLVGVGAGFTWSAAVVELLRTPAAGEER
ncbi:3-oxoacyl-[acyl-carrier-protein] synthase-3 [Nocardiopsis flavescens]|uniref:3-oxoacyl-[acyl-carrier-protein] synthase-3 n=1 Tax=Nocardiopsis flavescens TaxID=758803 RepID=A0A1M6BNR8_9ACTN|nr:ketoacyl-ACP synthase III family protein [Nocardiopsis flavescens]SHI50307.1 3-oxoacyl-[acyl-carrier-protein] synthase-3 [Nocardiopsis flavescens]